MSKGSTQRPTDKEAFDKAFDRIFVKRGCANCGSTEIHACTGKPPEPWTDEERQRLRTALEQVKERIK